MSLTIEQDPGTATRTLTGSATNGAGILTNSATVPPIRVGFVMHVMQVAGAEVLVREIIYQLSPRIEATIFCLDAVGAIGEELQAEGVEVIALGRRPGKDWRVARRLAELVRKRNIELLHAHQYTPLFYAALAKAQLKLRGSEVKVLFTEHGRHFPDIVSRKRRWANRLLFSQLTDATTAVCEFTRRSLVDVEGFSAKRIVVVENGIQIERYARGSEVKQGSGFGVQGSGGEMQIANCKLQNANWTTDPYPSPLPKGEGIGGTPRSAFPTENVGLGRPTSAPTPNAQCLTPRAEAKVALGLDPSRRYVTKVARFHPVKDHATLIRAFELVAKELDDVDLLLAGDGPKREETLALVRELRIEGRVKFLGVRGDVPELLAASDVFALTSVSEAASLTLLEAMASGVPCVVTDVGGNPELVRAGIDGLLAPRGDAAAIASAIIRILNDDELAAAMSVAGAARVREQFRLEQTVERYWEMYQGLVGRG